MSSSVIRVDDNRALYDEIKVNIVVGHFPGSQYEDTKVVFYKKQTNYTLERFEKELNEIYYEKNQDCVTVFFTEEQLACIYSSTNGRIQWSRDLKTGYSIEELTKILGYERHLSLYAYSLGIGAGLNCLSLLEVIVSSLDRLGQLFGAIELLEKMVSWVAKKCHEASQYSIDYSYNKLIAHINGVCEKDTISRVILKKTSGQKVS